MLGCNETGQYLTCENMVHGMDLSLCPLLRCLVLPGFQWLGQFPFYFTSVIFSGSAENDTIVDGLEIT